MFQHSSYNVVYAADDNFAPIMGISILSLFENNQNAKNISLTILDTNISSKNKKKIEDLCEEYGRSTPNWVVATNIENKIGMRVNTDRGSVSQYARIFLSEIFSKEIDRVLYLDCDTLVVSSLSELWNLDLDGNIIGAFNDAFSKYYRRNVGLAEDAVMFNSGIMLIDLKKWRSFNVEDDLLAVMNQYGGEIQQGDQGALNAVLSDRTKVLDPRYNMVSVLYELTYAELKLYRSPHAFYSQEEIEVAKKDPVIIHYTSSFMTQRPWEVGCTHPLKDLWISYRDKSDWTEDDFRSRKPKKFKRLVKILPKHLVLILAAGFQIYMRPVFYRLRSNNK